MVVPRTLRWRRESRANPSLKQEGGDTLDRAGVRCQAVEPSTRGEGAIKKFGINPMHYPLIKCPSGARQAAPQFKDLDTSRRPVKYKLGYYYIVISSNTDLF